MNVSINLLFEHISAGIVGDCSRCPLALAILPHLAPGVTITVMGDMEFRLGPQIGFATLPDEARRFIRRFDHGKNVQPFQFDLNIPPQFLGAGYGVMA